MHVGKMALASIESNLYEPDYYAWTEPMREECGSAGEGFAALQTAAATCNLPVARNNALFYAVLPVFSASGGKIFS